MAKIGLFLNDHKMLNIVTYCQKAILPFKHTQLLKMTADCFLGNRAFSTLTQRVM